MSKLNVLIVEDEALIAMDIEMIVTDEGHEVVAEAATLMDVVEVRGDVDIHLAFVDMQLADRSTGLDVAALVRKRWPEAVIVFVTANPKKIPEDFAGAHGLIAKPFSHAGFKAALGYIDESVSQPPPVSPLPSSFVASPAFVARWKPAVG